MPSYDYLCSDCEYIEEHFYQMDKAPKVKKCPKCGKRKMKRQIGTGAAIVFRGDGFYATDYPSENYKQNHNKAMAEEMKQEKAERGM